MTLTQVNCVNDSSVIIILQTRYQACSCSSALISEAALTVCGSPSHEYACDLSTTAVDSVLRREGAQNRESRLTRGW